MNPFLRPSQLLIAAGIILPVVTKMKPAQRMFYFVNMTNIFWIDNKMNIHTLIFLRFRCDAKFYIRKNGLNVGYPALCTVCEQLLIPGDSAVVGRPHDSDLVAKRFNCRKISFPVIPILILK